MNIRQKIIIFLILLLSSANVFAANLAKLNYLKAVDVFSGDKEIRVVIDLKKRLNKFTNPYFYEKSFQIDLPKTYLNPSKRLFSVKDDLIDNIYAVQHSPETTRIRFLFGKDKVTDMKDLSIKKDGAKLIISFKRKIIPPVTKIKPEEKITVPAAEILRTPPIKKKIVITSASAPAQNEEETDLYAADINQITDTVEEEDYNDKSISSALKLLESNDIKDFQDDLRNIKTTTGQTQQTKKDTAKTGSEDSAPLPVMPNILSLSSKMISSLAIVLAFVIFLSFTVKKYLSKNGKGVGRNKTIKIVSTCYIGPKKSIALVEVADELLVVGISNNHISMLTKLDKKETQEEAKPVMEDGKSSPDFAKFLNKAQSTEENKEGTISKVTEIIQERMSKMGAL